MGVYDAASPVHGLVACFNDIVIVFHPFPLVSFASLEESTPDYDVFVPGILQRQAFSLRRI